MVRPRLYADKTEGYAIQQARRKATRKAHNVEFIAIDGEGEGKGPQHKYVLLGCGKEYISNGGGLRFDDIATFLYNQYERHPDAAFVGFYLGYDFTQWLKTLPENRARMLLTEQGRISRARRKSAGNNTPFPVTYEPWEIDILGFKRLKLRRIGSKGWMYICDAGSFFQASLMSVIDPKNWAEPVVTEEEYAILEEGKRKRDSARLDDNMVRYNLLENVVLARLMDRLNRGFVQAGIQLAKNQWFGPGQAAQKWLGLQNEVPTSKDLPVVRFSPVSGTNQASATGNMQTSLNLGAMTYYGGWFEIFCHGHIPGYSYEFDINSAYPFIASRLPCLLHGQWTNGTNVPAKDSKGKIRIVHAKIAGSNEFVGAGLHRLPDGRISRPQRTSGYYWQSELDASVRAGLIDKVEYLEWWEYEPCKCPSPIRGIVGLYDQRIRAGKNTAAGKAYKLIYNSMYGKFAQSIGNPKYGNSVYASLITSGCREMILDAIATHPMGPRGVLMVATDGVYFLSPHPGLRISDKLGEWSTETHENLTLFKPGVYWDDRTRQDIAEGKAPRFKARGISARDFGKHIAEIDRQFASWPARYPHERDPLGPREGWFPQVTFTSGFSMISCQQALQRGKWFLAGSVGSAELIQDSDPVGKRHSGYYDEKYKIYRSRPYETHGWEESAAYDKRFGAEDPEEWGWNDDGYVLDSWKGMLQ